MECITYTTNYFVERIFENKYEDLINHAMEEKRGLNPESR